MTIFSLCCPSPDVECKMDLVHGSAFGEFWPMALGSIAQAPPPFYREQCMMMDHCRQGRSGEWCVILFGPASKSSIPAFSSERVLLIFRGQRAFKGAGMFPYGGSQALSPGTLDRPPIWGSSGEDSAIFRPACVGGKSPFTGDL